MSLHTKPFVFVASLLLGGCSLIHIVPKAQSDVPVSSDIGWWHHQDCVQIEDVEVRVLDSELFLFNNTSLIEIRVKGTMKIDTQHARYGRPAIAKMQISERFAYDEDGTSIAELNVDPVVETTDEDYEGEPIPFDVKVQRKVDSFQWARNRFRIRVRDKSAEFEIYQRK